MVKEVGSTKNGGTKNSLKGLARRIADNRVAYMFILPLLALLVVFKYVPLCMGFFESLFDWNGANINVFIGLENFKRVFQEDLFYISLLNTFIYTAAIIAINLTMPFMAAELVFNLKSERLQRFFKVGFVAPMVVPLMVIILMWRWILAGDYGVINMLMKQVGLGDFTKAWLGDPTTALGALVFINFPWISGLPFLLYLAGLQKIPSDLFEVSRIDGISVFKRIIYIDIPLVASQMKVVVIYYMMLGMQIFEQPFILTRGGPGTRTHTLALYIYDQGFTFSRFGYSSAIGVVLFAIILVITVINQKVIGETEQFD